MRNTYSPNRAHKSILEGCLHAEQNNLDLRYRTLLEWSCYVSTLQFSSLSPAVLRAGEILPHIIRAGVPKKNVFVNLMLKTFWCLLRVYLLIWFCVFGCLFWLEAVLESQCFIACAFGAHKTFRTLQEGRRHSIRNIWTTRNFTQTIPLCDEELRKLAKDYQNFPYRKLEKI